MKTKRSHAEEMRLQNRAREIAEGIEEQAREYPDDCEDEVISELYQAWMTNRPTADVAERVKEYLGL